MKVVLSARDLAPQAEVANVGEEVEAGPHCSADATIAAGTGLRSMYRTIRSLCVRLKVWRS